MRAVFSGAAASIAGRSVALGVALPAALIGLLLGGCQDSYASNAERDTHMGEVHVAPAASTVMSPFSALPPAAPTDVAAPTPVPAASVAAALAPVDAGAAKDAAPAHPAAGPAHHAKDAK